MAKSLSSEKKGGLHPAWLIFAACFMLNASTMGIVDNTYGLFYAPVCTAFGWKLSPFTAQRIFFGLSAAVAQIFVEKVYRRFPMKAVMGISQIGYAATAAAFGLQNSLAGFYILSVIQGICGAFVLYLPVPMLLNNWFVKNRGLALGLSASATGLFGAIVSPLLNSIIQSAGWRVGYFVRGALALVVGLPLVLLFVRKAPEPYGLKPFGAESAPADAEKAAPAEAEPELDYRLYRSVLVVAIGVFALFAVAFMQHLSNFAISSGLGASVGAAFASLAMIGNMVGKWIVGFSVDKFGTKKTTLGAFTAIFAAMIALSFGAAAKPLLYPAALLLGFSATFTGILVPASINCFTRSAQFGRIMSHASTGMMVSAALSPVLVGLVYDATGSYRPMFLIGAAVMAVSFVIAWILFSGRTKQAQ